MIALEKSEPIPVTRLAWLALGVVGGVATVGFFLGLAQSEGVVVPAAPPVTTPPGEALPALVYADLREHGHGPNARFRNSLASLISRPAEPSPGSIDRDTDQGLRDQSLSKRASRRSFNGAPPTIPHPVGPRDTFTCLACHGRGLLIGDVVAPKIPHPIHSQCTQCHVEGSSETEPFVASRFEGLRAPAAGPRAWTGAPPQIPHSTHQRGDCLSCHGPLGLPGMRTSHPERSQCLQCHASNAVLEQAVTAAPRPRGEP